MISKPRRGRGLGSAQTVLVATTPISISIVLAFLDPYTYANIDRKSFVTATVYKPAPDAKLGVIFAAKRTYGGYGILLKTIKPGSPFEATSLQTGMEIFAINNTSFHCVAEIGPFLRNAPEGIITIVAKPNASEIDGLYARDALRAIVVNKQVEKVGTTFFQTGANQIVVSKIADHSIFAGTALQVGSKVLSVNNRSGFSKLSDFTTALWTTMGTVTLLVEGPVPETNATATATLVDSEVPTTVDALTPYSEGSRPVASLPTALATPLSSPDFDPNFNMGMHSLVTASVWKPNKDFKLGVRLAANTDGTGTILNGLEPGSPLYATDLRVGMELLAVNNQPCTTPKQVASLLVACQGGHVTVLAKRSGGIPLLAVEGV